MATPVKANAESEKRLSDDEFLAKLDKAKPRVFPAVLAGKIDVGTINATCFNLINEHSQRLATLGRTSDGWAGLALFQPGNDRARLELMLDEDGPIFRLNNARGQQRLRLHVGPDGEPRMAFLDSRGGLRIALLIDHGRPHVMIFPRGASKRHVVLGTPLNKLPEPRSAWARAMRAARANQRERFESAARDARFVGTEVEKLWKFVRRRLRNTEERTTTPEDTLRDAGISAKRQARYQRRMSSLLAGRA